MLTQTETETQSTLWPDVNPKPLNPPPVEPFINLFSGQRINPLKVKASEIRIEDIAHGLALCNRFAGQSRAPISVAQHSWWVSRLCVGTPYELQGLLHDASEAYLGDVTKWLKASPTMAGYRAAEDRLQDTILSVFNQELELAPIVKWADKFMVCWEAEMAFGPEFFDRPMPPGYGIIKGADRALMTGWEFIDWEVAEASYLEAFYRLTSSQR